MLKYLYNKLIGNTKDKEYEVAKKALTDPKLFTLGQRAFLSSLFSTMWTHIDNLPQEDLLVICTTLNMFGFSIDTATKVFDALDLLAHQQIIEYNDTNPYLIRRV